jgi:hypothetical protein
MSRSTRPTAILLAAALACPAAASITSLVDSTGTLGTSFRNVSVNASGLLAFNANTDTANQRGIFTFDPGTSVLSTVALATTNSTVNTTLRDFLDLEVNAAGTVGFHALYGGSTAATRPQGILTGTGSGTTLIVKSGATTSVNAPVPLNNTVVFMGIDGIGRAYLGARSNATSPDNRWLLRGDGSPTTIVLDNATNYPNVQGGGFYAFSNGGGVVDSAGNIAFGAYHKPGPTAGDNGVYYYNATSGTVITVRDEDNNAPYTFNAAPDSLLSNGDILFQATAEGNARRAMLRYDASSGNVTPLMTNDGDFFAPSSARLNDSGRFVFSSNFDEASSQSTFVPSGVFSGNDPIANEVVVSGSSLFGGTIISVSSVALRSNDDVYFAYTLDTDNNQVADRGGIARVTALPVINQWNVDAGGQFSIGSNWSSGSAPTTGQTAKLGSVITANRTVTLDTPVSLDALSIDDNNSYTISGTATLTLAGYRYSAIGVMAGQHTITAPVVLAKTGSMNTQGPSDSLTLTDFTVNPGSTLVKNGRGSLNVNRVRADEVNILNGTLSIIPNGSDAAASRIGTLSINGGPILPSATLDLNDNDLIVTSEFLEDVSAYVAFARNAGAWDRPGITSSAAGANAITGLGVLNGEQYTSVGGTTFAGFAFSPTHVLVKYTYNGDTDFNGSIDFDDYARIDSAFLGSGEGTWIDGDSDYSGTIDFDDYALIDAAFLLQGGPLDSGRFGGGTTVGGITSGMSAMDIYHLHASMFGDAYSNAFWSLVPEPSALSILGLAGIASLRRRRVA